MKYKLLFYSIIIIYIIWLVLRYCNTKINFPCFFKNNCHKDLSSNALNDSLNDSLNDTPRDSINNSPNDSLNSQSTNVSINKIIPKRISRYPDVAQFIWNLRNYYYTNKPEYANIIENLNNFMQVYEDIMFNHLNLCSQNIDVAMDFSNNIQFHLNAMLLSIDPEGDGDVRLKMLKNELSTILEKYLARMQKKCGQPIIGVPIDFSIHRLRFRTMPGESLQPICSH